MSTCNRLDSESLGSWLAIFAQKLPGHWFGVNFLKHRKFTTVCQPLSCRFHRGESRVLWRGQIPRPNPMPSCIGTALHKPQHIHFLGSFPPHTGCEWNSGTEHVYRWPRGRLPHECAAALQASTVTIPNSLIWCPIPFPNFCSIRSLYQFFNFFSHSHDCPSMLLLMSQDLIKGPRR